MFPTGQTVFAEDPAVTLLPACSSGEGAQDPLHRIWRYRRRSWSRVCVDLGSCCESPNPYREGIEYRHSYQGVNMGTRFMCTAESTIHQNIKEKIVASTEQDTVHIFRYVTQSAHMACVEDARGRHDMSSFARCSRSFCRTLRNTARVFKNAVSTEVVRLERRPGGAKFEELRDLVSGARGRKVYEDGDSDAGIWS